MNKYFFTAAALFLGLFTAGVTHSLAQATLEDNPAGKKIVIDGKDLYEHGYNKDNTGATPSPREARDSVMVTSTMNYFVMPDKFFNKSYYEDQGSSAVYGATDRTKSEFVWTLGASSVASGTIAPQGANATGTSPWVKIGWGATPGAAFINVKEAPVMANCEAESSEIPVTVIEKPVIKFIPQDKPGAGGDEINELVVCVPPPSGSGDPIDVTVEYPIEATTESGQLWIDYEVTYHDLEGNHIVANDAVVTDFMITAASVTSTTVGDRIIYTISGSLDIKYEAYGSYRVKITRLTDRIARKCDVDGIVDDANGANGSGPNNIFTYIVVPTPKTGKTYHVPNNY